MMVYAILMFVLGITVFLYGAYVYYSRYPYLPVRLARKYKQSEIMIIGKAIMRISFAPILSGLIFCISDFYFALSLCWIMLIVVGVKVLMFTYKYSK